MSVKVSAMGAVEVNRMGLTGVMEITARGSSFNLEGRAGDMKEVAAAFERAKVAV